MRRVIVKGKYTGRPGILTYTGESITVPEAELAINPTRQHEEDVKAAHKASDIFFHMRSYEQLSFTVEEVRDYSPELHSTYDFEDLGTSIDLDKDEDEEA